MNDVEDRFYDASIVPHGGKQWIAAFPTQFQQMDA